MYEKVMKKMYTDAEHCDTHGNEGSVNLPAASKMSAAGRVK